MTVRPGAEPFSSAGGPVGVVLCHGFTGSPASLLPWAKRLTAAGHAVELPLLPGHGTRWQDMQLTRWPDWYAVVERSMRDLSGRCERVFVMGLSMGGTLALRLAEEHSDTVTGVVVVNPSLHSESRLIRLVPLLRHLIAAIPGVSNDIKRPDQDEVAYDRVPLSALSSLTQLWTMTSADLPRISQPLLVLASREDHVVEESNARELVASVSSKDVEYVELLNSYHVATLDYDADRIFELSLAFIDRLMGGDSSQSDSNVRIP